MNQRREGLGKPSMAEGAVEGSGGTSPQRRLDSKSRETIGNRLKALYDGVASEPVPDRFLDLLRQLDRKEQGSPE